MDGRRRRVDAAETFFQLSFFLFIFLFILFSLSFLSFLSFSSRSSLFSGPPSPTFSRFRRNIEKYDHENTIGTSVTNPTNQTYEQACMRWESDRTVNIPRIKPRGGLASQRARRRFVYALVSIYLPGESSLVRRAASERACVRAGVRACVRACVLPITFFSFFPSQSSLFFSSA